MKVTCMTSTSPVHEDDLLFAQFMEDHRKEVENGRTMQHAFQRMCRDIPNMNSWDTAERRQNITTLNRYNRILRHFNRLKLQKVKYDW